MLAPGSGESIALCAPAWVGIVARMKTLAVLGTGSDVGKSILTAGLCRLLVQAGHRVAPFKAQNMANNAVPALHPDGGWGEIGTAQGVQAAACGLVPRVEMNPILLKPEGGGRAQVVVEGRRQGSLEWSAYAAQHEKMLEKVLDCHSRLAGKTGAEIIVAEGAGGCAELNLMAKDIVNIPLTRNLNCPWILVADIDRGGIFVQVAGTRAVLPAADWDRCQAIIVNRLRGSMKYFQDGIKILEDLSGKPVFVIPYLNNLGLPDEDSVAIDRRTRHDAPIDPTRRQAIVVAWPHLAISSDGLHLEHDPSWQVHWLTKPPANLQDFHAIILPGSKSTRESLAWLSTTGWDKTIRTFAAMNRPVVGICGGYQALGESVADPDGIEGTPGITQGLGLLPITTTITPIKEVRPRTATLDGLPASGYELHCGRSFATEKAQALLTWNDGVSQEANDGHRQGSVCGCYLHGLLADAKIRKHLLGTGTNAEVEDPFERLAAHLAEHGVTAERILGWIQCEFEAPKRHH